MDLEIDNQNHLEYKKFKFKKPKSLVNGYFSKIMYNSSKFVLDTPYLKIENIKFTKNQSEISFKITEDLRDFFQKIYDIEEFVLTSVEKYSLQWFNKKLSINILYKNQIKPWIIDREGNIILKVKIRNNREFRKIQTGDYLALKIHLEGLSFDSKTFSSSWKCIDYNAYDENCNLFNNLDEEKLFSISLNEENESNKQEKIEDIVSKNEKLDEEIIENKKPKEVIIQDEKLEEQEQEPNIIEIKEIDDMEKIEEKNMENNNTNENIIHEEINTNNVKDRKKRKKKLKKKIKKKRIIYANKVKIIEPLIN